MKKYLIVVLPYLFSVFAFADTYSVINFVGFDNRVDFAESPIVFEEFYKEVLNINDSQYVHVPIDSPFLESDIDHDLFRFLNKDPHSYETYLERAISKIKTKKSPHLIVNIDSHGGEGLIYRQRLLGVSHIVHEDYVKLLFDKLRIIKDKKNFRVTIIYDACYGYSLVHALENGLRKYSDINEISFEVFTSSSWADLGYGNELIERIILETKEEKSRNEQYKFSLAPFSEKMMLDDGPRSTFMFWANHRMNTHLGMNKIPTEFRKKLLHLNILALYKKLKLNDFITNLSFLKNILENKNDYTEQEYDLAHEAFELGYASLINGSDLKKELLQYRINFHASRINSH